jgi:hypothetical protein
MSSGLDTVTRRQIRKAFGADALKVIEAHESALRAHAQGLERLDKNDGALAYRIDDARTHVLKLADEQRAYVDALDKRAKDRLYAFTGRTFWQRLRWLVRGK